MDVRSIRTPGLGDATYLLIHNGHGVLVDPQRDAERFLQAAAEEDVRVAFVLETHLHNDYVSGGREVARRTEASLVLPAGAGVAFGHLPAFHTEELAGPAGLSVRPLHTPGHTPEHLSYLVLIDGEPAALFSVGSLLIGSAGRPDLLGPQRARQLAILQYRSLQRLAALPPEVGLYPTHGQGSFCTSQPAGGRTTSTIGEELATNPVFTYADENAFVAGQLADLQPYPDYYAHMGPINLLGPTPMPVSVPSELTVAEVEALGPEVQLIDARPRAEFAAGHIPGSLGVELEDQFGVWVGWLVPFGAPLVLVLNPDQDLREATVQLGRIGYDDIRGVLRGLKAWVEVGKPVTSFPRAELKTFIEALDSGEARQVLDVRSPGEWEDGHLEASVHAYLPDLVERVPASLDPAGLVWVACGSGFRSAIAAGLLERRGFQPVLLDGAGIGQVLAERRRRMAL